jgi:hypothetical protein
MYHDMSAAVKYPWNLGACYQCRALSPLRRRSRPSSQRCQRPPLGADVAAPQKFAALQAGCLSPPVRSPRAPPLHQSPLPQRPTPASSPRIEGHYPVALPTLPVPADETPPLFLNLVPLPDQAPSSSMASTSREKGSSLLQFFSP